MGQDIATKEGFEHRSEKDHSNEPAAAFKDVCFSSLSIWEKQIDNAVEQVKEAINEMATKFSSLTSDLDNTLDKAYKSTEEIKLGDSSSSVKLADIFEQDEMELSSVLTALSQAQKSKKDLVEKFKNFKQFTSQLESMSEQVSANSRMTNILSLNARVEAARSDRNGQGFAIVAQEVRDLSISSAEIGKSITELVNNFSTAMTSVIDLAEQNEQQDENTLTSSQNAINEVMSRFKGITSSMSESSAHLHTTGLNIHNEIADVLVSLQFQDRVTQILENVSEQMSGFKEHANDDQNELESWLEIMRSTYTTEEQKLVHDGNEDFISEQNQPTVTFF